MRIPGRLWLAWAIVLWWSAAAASQEAGKVRVACVGDSITYGAAVEDRANNCYPAVLGKLLGDKYEVRNFGVSGATMLKKGDKPYWKEKAFTQAADFAPNIVVIKLGTNDTKPQNWKHKAEFEADARAMVRHFKELAGKPKVFVALPAAVPTSASTRRACGRRSPSSRRSPGRRARGSSTCTRPWPRRISSPATGSTPTPPGRRRSPRRFTRRSSERRPSFHIRT